MLRYPKAVRIELFNLRLPQMRAFHMAWLAFFLCFFAWFGLAPLMTVIREELELTPAQIGNTIIASVAITVVARLLVGWLCDRVGPRIAYSGLLVLGSLPVMGITLAQNYETFLLFRLMIGAIGAGFVITQFHTSVMFAPNVVGTANATTAGWGNLGGGVTQFAMPMLFSCFLALGASEYMGWRLCMLVAGVICMATGIAYYFFTQDTPSGNYGELRRRGLETGAQSPASSTFLLVCRDRRVWALFFIYAACFGIELTINNVAALYFTDYFTLDFKTAGVIAALFGLMNVFARTLGGVLGDRFGRRHGLKGRVRWVFIAVLSEGILLMAFSKMATLVGAIALLILFSLFVQMSEGATFSVAPFINRHALGSVAGIVGAGGNAGAVMAGFLFKGMIEWPLAFLLLGALVACCSFLAFSISFSADEEQVAETEMRERLRELHSSDAIELARAA